MFASDDTDPSCNLAVGSNSSSVAQINNML